MKKIYGSSLIYTGLLCLIFNLVPLKAHAELRLIESSLVTNEAFYFWKADDSKPYHYGRSINPHGNCMKTVNGYVFYTWYRGGWSDRTLMVSRKKIGSGEWKHIAFNGKKLSLVGGKGDTHLTTNIGVCPIDGTIHIMYDHHNEDLNYIVSKKGIAFAPDSEFKLANFLPQRDYLQVGKKMTGVTYPDMFTNDAGELLCVRRKGSAVGGDVLTSYYDGKVWSKETKMFQGTGAEVSQGDRNFTYGSAKSMNGTVYYSYSIRWAESPTRLNEGVYLANCGPRMNEAVKDYKGRAFPLPIINHDPFFIADPRSIPDNAGWAGGATAAVSDRDDMVLTIVPKGGVRYTYLKPANEEVFSQKSGVSNNGTFYGNRLYRFYESGGKLVVQSCYAGSLNWRVDLEKQIGNEFNKSIMQFDKGTLVAVFAEPKNSDQVPIRCFVVHIDKPEYTPQSISFEPLNDVTLGDADVALHATASSNLPVTFASSDVNIAEVIDGNKLKIRGVGACQIKASQAGNGQYDSARVVSQTVVVNANTSKTDQSIQFTMPGAGFKWGDADEVLHASASSNLPVNFEISDPEVAEVVNGKLHVKRAGNASIRAMQAGNATFNPAPIVSYELNIPVRPQVITFEAIPEVLSGVQAFKLLATSNNPNAKLKFDCPNNQVAIVWRDHVRYTLAAGSAEITVSDVGNAYFTPASVKRTLKVQATTFKIPSQIEAEHCIAKKGVNVTRWSNSIFYLNAWETNDYAEYSIDVPKDGTYPIEISAAAPAAGKKLKIMSGNKQLTTVTLTPTPSLTRFLSSKSSLSLKAGVQKIKVVGVVGGYNLDWLKITAGTVVTPPDTPDTTVPVLAKDYVIARVDSEQDPNVASNLFDGNTDDDARWSANGFPKSVVIDLGAEKEMVGVKVWPYQSRAYQYTVEVSDSLTGGYTQVVDRTGNTASGQALKNEFDPQKGRYVKLTVTGCHNYDNTWVSINEFEVMLNDLSTEVPDVAKPDVDVYVANKQLFVETPYENGNEIYVYSITGKRMLHDVFDGKDYVGSINLQTGIYVVRVRNKNNRFCQKVWIK